MCDFCKKSNQLLNPVRMVFCELDPSFLWMAKEDNLRLYEIAFVDWNEYISSQSSGQRNYTKENAGPYGEPIQRRIRFWITEGYGFIAAFEEWADVRHFILSGMRAKVVETIP